MNEDGARWAQSQAGGRGPSALRRLGSADEEDLRNLIAVSPEAYCLVAQELGNGLLARPAADREVLGWVLGGRLRSALMVGATIVPVETTDVARRAMSARLARTGCRSAAIVGFADEVIDLQRRLEPCWRPRLAFADQPLFAIRGDARVEPDRLIRQLDSSDIDLIYPASVAMFTEELGIPPTSGVDDHSFRLRVRSLLEAGRVFGRIEAGSVLFKAEVGVIGADACHVQGVWVAPGRRGEGLAAPALAAVVQAARQNLARSVCLYANASNIAALRTYQRVGFRRIGTFATVVY